MGVGKRMRARFAMAVAVGALALGTAHGVVQDGAQKANDWSQAQAAHYMEAPPGSSTARAPDPPSKFVLIETSASGSALGFEIGALAKRLGGAIDEGSAPSGEESLEILHETVCFVVFWLLKKQIDPGGPRELARTINAYLAIRGMPRLNYPRARRELAQISLAITQVRDSGQVARDVAEAACEQA